MPTSKYFQGHGKEVMKDMVKEYGAEKGRRIFYATANKKKKKRSKDKLLKYLKW